MSAVFISLGSDDEEALECDCEECAEEEKNAACSAFHSLELLGLILGENVSGGHRNGFGGDVTLGEGGGDARLKRIGEEEERRCAVYV